MKGDEMMRIQMKRQYAPARLKRYIKRNYPFGQNFGELLSAILLQSDGDLLSFVGQIQSERRDERLKPIVIDTLYHGDNEQELQAALGDHKQEIFWKVLDYCLMNDKVPMKDLVKAFQEYVEPVQHRIKPTLKPEKQRPIQTKTQSDESRSDETHIDTSNQPENKKEDVSTSVDVAVRSSETGLKPKRVKVKEPLSGELSNELKELSDQMDHLIHGVDIKTHDSLRSFL